MVLDDIRSCVARAPDAIAVQDGELRLTYLELASHACGLAAGLARRGIGQDDVVAVYADRSAELVVAELSVLLAGAAYLPLDPAHPAARTRELLALSGAAAVISTGPLSSDDALRGHDLEVVDLTEVPPEPLAVPARPDDATLAYVIFTSGSTGRPKGVAVSHGSLANLMRWHREGLPAGSAGPDDVAVQPRVRRGGLGHLAHPGGRGDAGGAPAHVRTSPPDLVAWLADEQITATLPAHPAG